MEKATKGLVSHSVVVSSPLLSWSSGRYVPFHMLYDAPEIDGAEGRWGGTATGDRRDGWRT